MRSSKNFAVWFEIEAAAWSGSYAVIRFCFCIVSVTVWLTSSRIVSVCSVMMVSHYAFILSSISAGFWRDSVNIFCSSVLRESIVLSIDCFERMSVISSFTFLRLSLS